MNWLDIVSVVLNVLLGGGLVVTLSTLKATREKASEEVNELRARIEGQSIDNDEKASRVMQEFIVEPLKRELKSVRRVVNQLTKAIDRVSECRYKEQCPVKDEMLRNDDNDNDN